MHFNKGNLMTNPCDLCDTFADAIGSTECGTVAFCMTCADDNDSLEQVHVGDEIYYYIKETSQ
jgi:hypothetical protein